MIKKATCRCGKNNLKINETKVLNRKTGEESILYNAYCSKCRRTIYTDDMKEMIR